MSEQGLLSSADVSLCAQFGSVLITFDPERSERNVRLRGLSFEQVANFASDSALFVVDDRKEYAETRIVAIGLVGDRVHALRFTETREGIRVISFRNANA